MRLTALFFLATIGFALPTQAAGFRELRMEERGARLAIVGRDGATFFAHRIDEQDGFAQPGVSPDGQHAGWLALLPDRGASYSLPVYLVVMDASRQVRRFSGEFGMIFGWCFAKNASAVVYRYQFPHGVTPIGFDMRRLKDGRLLRRVLLGPVKPDEDETAVVRAKAPAWTGCVRDGAATK